uniref:WH2 domain-containing protein n=1 Tax=Angiostrongylus cantonensis TaxID=6313 RepID=A0A0K0DQG5_ANGCA
MRGVASSYDDKPPPPPLRFSSGGSGTAKEQSVVGLKPLPKEPLDSGKKKKSMTNPFVKSELLSDFARIFFVSSKSHIHVQCLVNQ